MKYIRTKDGVYELVDTYYMCVNGVETYMYNNKGRGVEINGNQIIKEADTIEELCDWFFLEGANCYPINYKKFYTAKRAKERMQIEQDLYGVIHVKGKGLIYVAKMNDKGELVLK